MPQKMIFILSIFFASVPMSLATEVTHTVSGGDSFERELREALVEALQNQSVPHKILLPEGEFFLKRSLVIDGRNIEFLGAGRDKTILDFSKSRIGPEGILVRGQNILVANLSIMNAEGDGIKIVRSEHVTLRKLHVSWQYPEGTPAAHFGGYAIYPVMSRYILVEGCEASYAADAGVYIGQSSDVILRNNKVHHNSIGLEAENSLRVDMIDNHAFENSVGIVLLAIPDIPEKVLSGIRIVNNTVENNNTPNLGVENAVVADLPAGIGVLMVGPDNVEMTDNFIHDHRTTGAMIVHYGIIGVDLDPDFEGIPENISIARNRIEKSGYSPKGGLSTLSQILIKGVHLRVSGLVFDLPDIVWDGMKRKTPPGTKTVCLGQDSVSRFANMNWPKKLLWVDRKKENYACELQALNPVIFPKVEGL